MSSQPTELSTILEESDEGEAVEALAPLRDALNRFARHGKKIANRHNAMEERIGKLEERQGKTEEQAKEMAVAQTKTETGWGEVITMLGGVEEELTTTRKDGDTTSSRVDHTVNLLKGVFDDLSKRFAQASLDLSKATIMVARK